MPLSSSAVSAQTLNPKLTHAFVEQRRVSLCSSNRLLWAWFCAVTSPHARRAGGGALERLACAEVSGQRDLRGGEGRTTAGKTWSCLDLGFRNRPEANPKPCLSVSKPTGETAGKTWCCLDNIMGVDSSDRKLLKSRYEDSLVMLEASIVKHGLAIPEERSTRILHTMCHRCARPFGNP